MLAPLSWLKDYTDLTLSVEELSFRLTELGLNVEEIKKEKDDYILNLEITPNRPDCLSIIGIAREIAALENTKINLPKTPKIPVSDKCELIKIKNDFNLCPRLSCLIIKGVKIDKSPSLIEERLIKTGQRPINNIVDISNYVMLETGNPIHIFDYDQIQNHSLHLLLSQGQESFTSVDNLNYILPKNAIIIKDKERVIDLCGIKGGLNSGVSEKTCNILILVPVYHGVYVRKASQKLNLHSEASAIFERGVDAGNTIYTLQRTADLILKFCQGKIASPLIDLREKNFQPWTIRLNTEKVNKTLGLKLSTSEITSLLERLSLEIIKSKTLTNNQPLFSIPKQTELKVKIPTFRNDLQIEEDLIEEIARLYGYNKFPKSIPSGPIPTEKIPYYKDYKNDFRLKNILKMCGFSEIYTYSLISSSRIKAFNLQPDSAIRLENPISSDYEYLRPTLVLNVLSALSLNQPHFDKINLFELGKIYKGNLENPTEIYEFCAATNEENGLAKLKGVLEVLNKEFNLSLKIGKPNSQNSSFNLSAGIILNEKNKKQIGLIGKISPSIQQNFSLKKPVYVLQLNYTELLPFLNTQKVFIPLPKYPPVIEEFTLSLPEGISYAEIIKTIQSVSPLISEIQFLGLYQNYLSLKIYYQSHQKTLSSNEVQTLRAQILSSLKKIKVHLKT